MTVRKKRVLLILIGILLTLAVILGLFANSFIENKITVLLKEHIPTHIEASYEEINVQVFKGRIAFKNPQVNIKLKNSERVQSHLKMSSFTVGGISYWNYFVNKNISLASLEMKDLTVITYKDRKNPTKDSTAQKALELPGIKVSKISLQNATITVYDASKDSTFLHTKQLSLVLQKVLLNNNTIQEPVPINYQSITIATDSTFIKAGAYENVYIGSILLKNNTLSLQKLLLKTKYSKKELSRIITRERDHFHVALDEVTINRIDYGKKKDSTFFSSNFIEIKNPNAQFYRDKLVADDLKVKKLYSRSIRELPLRLTIDSIAIENGKVTYSEKTKKERPPGVLHLSNLNAGISDLSNTYKTPTQTRIEVTGIFMKNSPLKATWQFDVNKTNDAFTFKGHVGKLMTANMNDFITPILNVELKGEVTETDFVITGDYNQSVINIAQDYDDININILNKKHKKMKALSSIANVFINDDSDSGGKTFHNVTANTTRDKTKSFFNYLAKNLKASLFVMYTQKNKSHKKKKKLKKKKA